MLKLHILLKMIYAVEITRAFPDWKRPSTTNEVKYFTSLENATKYLRDTELQICYEYIIPNDKDTCKCCDEVECDYKQDGECECGCFCNCHGEDEDDTLRFQPRELYENIYKDYIYSDSYMDMDAFSSAIYSIDNNANIINIEKNSNKL